MLKHISALTVGALLGAVVLYGAPRTAAACSGCSELKGITVAHASVAPDGVLVFNYESTWGPLGGLGDIEEKLALEVRDGDGAPLEGKLERAYNRLVWRPACQLDPGAVLHPRFEYSDPDPAGLCGGPVEQKVFETASVRVAEEPLAPLALPEACFSTVYSFAELNTGLDDLACCDGAFPYHENDNIGGCEDEPPTIHYDAGSCAVVRGFGQATARFSWTPALGDEDAANTVALLEYERPEGVLSIHSLLLELDASSGARALTMTRSEALDVRLTLHSLATGERVSGPWVRSNGDVSDMYLGSIEVDRSAELDAACADAPYTCEIIQGASPAVLWDSEECAPYQHSMIDPSNIGNQDPTQCALYSGAEEALPPERDLPQVCEGAVDTETDTGTDGEGEAGCGCAATSPRDAGLLLLLLLSPLRARRRRSR